MKIIVVGGTGLIGKAVVQELSERHVVIPVGHSEGKLKVDISDPYSIQSMFEAVGKFDALVSTAGTVVFKEFSTMTLEDYQLGIKNKLLGQVGLVTIGTKYVNDQGSFTLISGILNRDPIRTGASAAMVNGALEGFVKSAAIEMTRGIRLNLVSPTVVTEAMSAYAPYFRGYVPVPVAEVALAFSKSVEGLQTGQIIKVGYV